jgi:hypothetical protein
MKLLWFTKGLVSFKLELKGLGRNKTGLSIAPSNINLGLVPL